jgi:FkbM family methyltransferase
MITEFKYNDKIVKFSIYSSDYISSILKGKNFYEQFVLEYIKTRFSGGTVLDIGANIGNHAVYFSKFIFDKVYAFEANQKNFALLEENKKINDLGDDKLMIYHTALSDGHYNFKSQDVSENMGGSKVIEGSGELITSKIDDYELPKIDFIKIDVEGHELKVLKGADNLIKRDFPEIMLECNANTASDLKIISPYMKELGYEQINSFSNILHYFVHKKN